MTRAGLQQVRDGGRFAGRLIDWTSQNYPTVSIGHKSRPVHVLVWEAVNGPKPAGMQIHHIDEDKNNFSLDNLMLVSPLEHARIHHGWIRENGDWVARPCGRCKQILPLDAFHSRTGKRASSRCKPCDRAAHREYRSRPGVAAKIAQYHQKHDAARALRGERRNAINKHWQARIAYKGIRYSLGYFQTAELANQARIDAAAKFAAAPATHLETAA